MQTVPHSTTPRTSGSTVDNGTTGPAAASDPAVAELLARLDVRLARLESVAARLEGMGDDARALAATASDIADETAARIGDVDARLRGLTQVAERFSRPETLRQLEQLADLLDSAPKLGATMVDAFDEVVAAAAAEGVDPEAVVKLGKDLFVNLARLATHPDVKALLDSGMLDARAVAVLGEAARAIAEAGRQPTPRVGLLGTLRALGRGDIQRAVGFLMEVAGRFGGSLDRAAALPQSTASTSPTRPGTDPASERPRLPR